MSLNARDEDGNVIDHAPIMKEAVDQCEKDGTIPLLQSVYPSGTGIQARSQFDLAETVEKLGGLFVANAYQGRLEKYWPNQFLSRKAIVMTSGSKFFRGPPHSGAVFVPK